MLCELIWCAGEESVGLYMQKSTVKHPQPLIAVNYKFDTSRSTTVHVNMGCGFVCYTVKRFICKFSNHTLILTTRMLIRFGL